MKETNEGKESFFNNEDLLENRLAKLMSSLYANLNDESLFNQMTTKSKLILVLAQIVAEKSWK